jgi:hypothetical protein
MECTLTGLLARLVSVYCLLAKELLQGKIVVAGHVKVSARPKGHQGRRETLLCPISELAPEPELLLDLKLRFPMGSHSPVQSPRTGKAPE